MLPSKNVSAGDVLHVNPSPYESKTSQEMGHFIREARNLTRNNTFIGLEATKDDGDELFHLDHKASLNRWSSEENMSLKQPDRSSETRDTLPSDRRCSMIPLMCQPAVRPKVSHASIEREKLVRKKPPIPPKALAKQQDHIKVYRAERLQQKKLDFEQQLEELREQVAGAELTRQREDQLHREQIEVLKGEINDLKSTCVNLNEAVQRLQNSDDLFLKMKQEGEFSFYSRSYEVSKKILSNTFRRRKTNSARATCFDLNVGTSRDTAPTFQSNDQCALSDTATSTLNAIEQPGVSSEGGAGDQKLCRPNSAPETPMNIVTSLYYVSKIQSLEMDDASQERNDTENPSLQTSEQELVTKKKTRMSKIGGWFKPGKR
uniref:Uncharacterized protein n=1 Tax=Anopheles culicifacies TaxID=139723 RepID=A0A182M5N7_9DIPT